MHTRVQIDCYLTTSTSRNEIQIRNYICYYDRTNSLFQRGRCKNQILILHCLLSNKIQRWPFHFHETMLIRTYSGVIASCSMKVKRQNLRRRCKYSLMYKEIERAPLRRAHYAYEKIIASPFINEHIPKLVAFFDGLRCCNGYLLFRTPSQPGIIINNRSLPTIPSVMEI